MTAITIYTVNLVNLILPKTNPWSSEREAGVAISEEKDFIRYKPRIYAVVWPRETIYAVGGWRNAL